MEVPNVSESYLSGIFPMGEDNKDRFAFLVRHVLLRHAISFRARLYVQGADP